MYMYAAASIWFEIWGFVGPGEKYSILPVKFSKNFDFPAKNFRQINEKFRFFHVKISEIPILVIYSKMSFCPDKICHLQLNSKQIILFRLKSHHFRTYFLYMIRCNNVSRPVLDPAPCMTRPATPYNPQPKI